MLRRTPLRRTGFKRVSKGLRRSGRLRSISPRRQHKMQEYWTKRDAYMATHPLCEVSVALFGVQLPSEDLHHKKGRWGDLLTDERYFMAVSRLAHDWIHSHGDLARARGWLG